MRTPTPQEVEKIFKEKFGIFENTTNQAGIAKLDADFKKERERFDEMSFDIPPIRIQEFRNQVKDLEKTHPTMSHLSIFYGLDGNGRSASMKLIFRGMHLSDNFDIVLFDEARPSSRMSLMSSNRNSAGRQLNNFRNKFDGIHGEGKYINGCYLKLDGDTGGDTGIGLYNLLDILEGAGSDIMDIRFGFMNPEGFTSDVVDVGLTCFHMIFSGRNSNDASRIFSTFDNDSGYSGPKPACPPFCPK